MNVTYFQIVMLIFWVCYLICCAGVIISNRRAMKALDKADKELENIIKKLRGEA